MCGIAGILRFDGHQPDVEALRAMGGAQAHRGPDDHGVFVDGPCGLAHRRLAIIDLGAGGHQPMQSPDGRFTLVYNGELYNHVELRAELEARGHAFRSRSDSEVVLRSLIEWQEDAFPRFNGMWALALWDRDDQRLTLCRDRLGIKPLFVLERPDSLVFASEAKAIAAVHADLALDRRAVLQLMRQDASVFAERTFFEGVTPVAPATVLSVEDGKQRTTSFWQLPGSGSPPPATGKEAEQLRELLTDAIRLRFRSDVEVGTCLSGGLDSSSIVALSSHALERSPQCFSAVYDVAGFAEGRFVDEMTTAFGLRTHRVSPDGASLPSTLAEIVHAQEAPIFGPGVITQWHVMRLASQHVKVLLDGQGADELFGGYHHYLALRWLLALREASRGRAAGVYRLLALHREVRTRLGQGPTRYLLRLGSRSVWWRHLAPALRGLLSPHQADERVAELLWPGLVSPEVGAIVDDAPPTLNWTADDPLDATLRHAITTQVLPQLLHYEDRSSMAFSLEARVPFLDHRVVEMAVRLPSTAKVDRAVPKAVLRRAVRGVVPDAIIDRTDKLGYPTPAAAWFRQHTDWLHDLLLSPQARQRELLRPEAVRRVIDEHLAGRHDHSHRLTQMASLELFCRQFIDGSG